MSTIRIPVLASLGLGLLALGSNSCAGQRASYQPAPQPAQQPFGYAGTAQAPTPAPAPVAAPRPVQAGVVTLTAANFDATINQPGAVVLVDFSATWCGPCRQLEPVIERVARDFGGQAIIARVDVDNDPQIATRFGVEMLPTLAYFKHGQLQTVTVGPATEQAIAAQLRHLMR